MAGRAAFGICGNPAVETEMRLTAWGVMTSAEERWCVQCAAEAAELLESRL